VSAPDVQRIETTVRSGEKALVWAPVEGSALPVVVLVHGSHCTPAMYDGYATGIAREGFLVVAPEQVRTVFGDTAHYPQQAFMNWGHDWAIAENDREGSPLFGRVDTDHVFITGHSMGGGVSLGVASDFGQMGLVDDDWSMPKELVAAVVNGTHNIPPPRTGDPLPVDNKVPIAFFSGSIDSLVTLDQVSRTFAGVRGVKPYLQVVLEGGNHFFLNDEDSPPGARPDPNTMAIPQDVSVDSTARWTALWFKANLGDEAALAALESASAAGNAGASADEPHVKVSYITQ
jgi:dienelactone hydrolase